MLIVEIKAIILKTTTLHPPVQLLDTSGVQFLQQKMGNYVESVLVRSVEHNAVGKRMKLMSNRLFD